MDDKNSYNLIDEPWIPVLMRDGKNCSVSLGDVFADSDGVIADLALNPYERVAVFRLLLCIAQAALGPERLKDERAWKAVKDDIGPVGTAYLKKWHDRFFLYGPHAFLQPDDVKTAKGNDDASTAFNSDINKICLARASGNNSTLFDHEATHLERLMSNSERIINLLVFQSFSSGGRFSQCKWDGIESPKSGSAFSSPCRENDILFSIMIGDDLLETVWLNLLTKAILDSSKIQLGVPLWEINEMSRASLKDCAWTYLGHLLPFSRIVKMTTHNSGVIMGEGIVYPTLNPDKKDPGKRPYGWRDPMATVMPNGDELPVYVSANPTRMPWRDLASLLNVQGSRGVSSALMLRHRGYLPDEKEFVLWVGGLSTDQAKDLDVVEWMSRLSTDLLEAPNNQQYQTAINYADHQCGALYSACKSYALMAKTPDATKPIKKNKENELVAPVFQPAERIYWDTLAQPTNQWIVQNVKSETYWDDWKKATREAAVEAYRRACPAMNARQMEAFAQGFAKLMVRDDTKKKLDPAADSEDKEE